MNKMFKDALILFVITIAAGIGLGFVYNITSDARAKQEEKTKIKAYEAVMSGMDKYSDLVFDAGKASEYINQRVKDDEKKNGIVPIKDFNAEIDNIVLAKDKMGKELGYIITVTDNEAYGGSLKMTVGIKLDGTVEGISFLTLKETPGLGMKADDDSFKGQFKNKNADFFKYEKSGAFSDSEVNAISSATITTNAVTHGVNAAIYCFDYIVGGGE